MIRYALIIALLPAAALAGPRPSRDAPDCARIGDGLHAASSHHGEGGFRRLDQLPPANEYRTVLRSEDGCQTPVIVRYDVDGRASGR